MTLHFKDQRGAAWLSFYRKCTEITVLTSEQKPYPCEHLKLKSSLFQSCSL